MTDRADELISFLAAVVLEDRGATDAEVEAAIAELDELLPDATEGDGRRGLDSLYRSMAWGYQGVPPSMH